MIKQLCVRVRGCTKELDENVLKCDKCKDPVTRRSWADIAASNARPVAADEEGWTKVPEKPNNDKVKTGRQRLDILRGTAISETEGESLSADIHLVAYGVAKNVTGLQLSQWLAGKDLHVLSCDLLTKYEGARSLAYKITIKSCDYDKAINPAIWPNRVGLRSYKFFDPRKEKNEGDRAKGRATRPRSFRMDNNNSLQPSNNSVRLQPILRRQEVAQNVDPSENLPSFQNRYHNENPYDGNLLQFHSNYQVPSANLRTVSFRDDLAEGYYV